MTPFARIPWRTWRPKLFELAASYDRRSLASDVVAGLTVGVVALPLAMAFGIASTVTPQAGIRPGDCFRLSRTPRRYYHLHRLDRAFEIAF